ncbi:MAG TPA: hypothetical protein VGC71_05230 [Gaiellales bacterium]
MSCSVHDAVRLERRGIATAVVGTEPFVDEAIEQARVLGMPDMRIVTVPHPVQILTTAQVHDLADMAIDEVERRLTAPA